MNELMKNISKIHTTKMGILRISNNLNIDSNKVVDYCKKVVLDCNSKIYKKGKNWYCENNNIKITINSSTYTIITAHYMI